MGETQDPASYTCVRGRDAILKDAKGNHFRVEKELAARYIYESGLYPTSCVDADRATEAARRKKALEEGVWGLGALIAMFGGYWLARRFRIKYPPIAGGAAVAVLRLLSGPEFLAAIGGGIGAALLLSFASRLLARRDVVR